MRATIRQLSEQTINQIAAGEVVENPASVVKELVENAIDARARFISVEILGGGFQKITVKDDGVGMSEEDALLSISRHATSKLSSIEDFSYLSTMGFRGEALASIGAISQLTLNSANDNSQISREITVEGGVFKSKDKSSRHQGTTVEVRHLFYNVPVRRKFQKSALSSVAEINKTMTLLALSHPSIGFSLKNDGKELLHLAGQTDSEFLPALLTRSKSLLEKEFVELGNVINYEDSFGKIQGILGDPTQHRGSRGRQYLFVNQRAVTSPLISRIISEIYATKIPANRHPAFVIHLTLPPAMIDVNVHPQKKELRFRDPAGLFYFFRKTILLTVEPSLEPSPCPVDEGAISRSVTSASNVFQPLSPKERYHEALTAGELQHAAQATPNAEPQSDFSLHISWEPGIVLGSFFLLPLPEKSKGKSPAIALLVDLAKIKAIVLPTAPLSTDQAIISYHQLLVPLELSLSSIELEQLRSLAPMMENQGLSFVIDDKNKIVRIDKIPTTLSEEAVEELILEWLTPRDETIPLSSVKPQKASAPASFCRAEALFLLDRWNQFPKNALTESLSPIRTLYSAQIAQLFATLQNDPITSLR